MCSPTTSSRFIFTTTFVFSFVILAVMGHTTNWSRTTTTTVKPGTILQNQLNKMNQRLDDIDLVMLHVILRLSYLENHKPDGISSIEKKVDNAEKSIKHLQSVNQIWKSNFKSIKETFQQLREKNNLGKR